MPSAKNTKSQSSKDFSFTGPAIWDSIEKFSARDKEIAFKSGAQAIKIELAEVLEKITFENLVASVPPALQGRSTLEIEFFKLGVQVCINEIRISMRG